MQALAQKQYFVRTFHKMISCLCNEAVQQPLSAKQFSKYQFFLNGMKYNNMVKKTTAIVILRFIVAPKVPLMTFSA